MLVHKSLVEYYSSLAQRLHADVAYQFGASTADVARDAVTMTAKLKHHGGVSFYTKELPAVGKWLDSGMSRYHNCAVTREGSAHELFSSFPAVWERDPEGFPLLFGWMWRSLCPLGSLLPLQRGEVPAELVRAARQLLYFAYKLELPYDPEDTQKVLEGFVSTDSEVARLWNQTSSDWILGQYLKKARTLTCRVFHGFDHRDILPKHGPGAVATGEKRSGKFTFRRLYRAIEQVYPFTEYFMFNLNHVCEDAKQIADLQVLDTGTAKVVLVPKDSRGPRLISCEPLEYQWVQQGLGNKMRDWLETHRLTRKRVNFTDQTINQNLAILGSKTGEWVTLDMKDASDRVSLELVKTLFQGTPLLEALLATRSSRTKLPNGTLITLNKFAPMGSNLCFPVEAFVFWVIAAAALHVHYAYPLSQAGRRVYVYGDDIICRVEDYDTVQSALTKAGLLFNEQKCCTHGQFRESCGVEAYNGHDVTPVRFRTVWRPDKVVASSIASYVAYSNALWRRGYYESAEFVEIWVQRMLATHKQIVKRRGLQVRKPYPPIPYYSDSPLGADSVKNQRTYMRGAARSVNRIIAVNKTECLSIMLGFVRNPKSSALYENQFAGVKYRYNKRYQRTEILGLRIQSRHVFEATPGYRLLLASWAALAGLPQDESWWEPEDVVRAQLRAATKRGRLGQGFYPVARALTLVRAWSPI